jgi:hypothetical protein
MILALFDGPGWDRGGVILDGVARPRPTFTFFMIGFFNTSAFHFLTASWEASEPRTGHGAYDTPICSKTHFKRLPFGIFATMRVSYSFGSKLSKILLASVSISTKKCSACSASTAPTVKSGQAVSTFDMGVMPKATLSKKKLVSSGYILHVTYSLTASRPPTVRVA